MVDALLVAQRTFDQPHYGELARVDMQWFYGRNRLDAQLYDDCSGGWLWMRHTASWPHTSTHLPAARGFALVADYAEQRTRILFQTQTNPLGSREPRGFVCVAIPQASSGLPPAIPAPAP